nr:glycerate kinase [Pseudomonas aeruginosa]
MAQGVRDSAPDAQIVCMPMADGGEGTVDAVLAATGGERRVSTVQGPLGVIFRRRLHQLIGRNGCCAASS